MTLPFETNIVPNAEDEMERDLLPALQELALRNNFFANLHQQYKRYGGSLTPKQWACVEREVAKRKPAPADSGLVEAASAIAAKLASASEHLKKPSIRLVLPVGAEEGTEFRFSPAPANGQNAGWLYVKTEGSTDWGWGWAYFGKVNPQTGQVAVSHVFRDWVSAADFGAALATALEGGLDAALLKYGSDTGNCGCCGRELTEELSVKSGIGPVCAARFGFDREAIIANQA